jgi:hypothetical protein
VTTITRPSGRLAAYPVKPSSSARDRVHHRKPTPCTWPCTHAVSRTSGSYIGDLEGDLGTRLEGAPDRAHLVDGTLDDDQHPLLFLVAQT